LLGSERVDPACRFEDDDVRVLFLQHDPGADPGLVGDALSDRGATIDLLPMATSIDDATWHGRFPRLGEHDLLVPLGAIWSVYDDHRLGSWVDRELALLRQADDVGIPVLGICFGGQALAMAHGGAVESMGTTEVGFGIIESVDPSRIPVGPWMQWHSDRFTPPDDARVLATADLGVQAFTLRRNLGLQFHPEVTDAIISRWVELGGDAAREAALEAGTTVEDVLGDARAQRKRARADVGAMLDWWLPAVQLA
jgi:GMP synthase-like glutamine amidotransferase